MCLTRVQSPDSRSNRMARLSHVVIASLVGLRESGVADAHSLLRLQQLTRQRSHSSSAGGSRRVARSTARQTARGTATSQSVLSETPYPFYHTTAEIHEQVLALASRCNGWLSVESRKEADGPAIDVVSIRKTDATPTDRFFLLFGEHARELISAESGLHFLQTVCGESPLAARSSAPVSSLLQNTQAQGLATSAAISKLLDSTEIRMVVNGNPESRARVETGEYCLRVNTQNSVDLNRNWDDKWEPSDAEMSADTNPGPKPFSEPETRVFLSAVREFEPTGFLTIHSGTRGMYMPWAYNMVSPAQRNGDVMLQMLQTLDENFCQCPFGAAGKEVGYSCPGTCLDYVYDKLHVDYSFAFEIYGNPSEDASLKERFDEIVRENAAASAGNTNVAPAAVATSLLQLGAAEKVDTSEIGRNWREDSCFSQFNPTTQEDFEQTLENWTQVYLKLAGMIVKDRAAKSAAGGAGTAPVLLPLLGQRSAAGGGLRGSDDFPVWRP
mmetsp:Transcript_24493/g.61605  ORF Transcript_24493/g.61605 Transcript_24493/m.61605 type:complete len:498 (-) Transcript_24493:165-1658(-)